MRVVFLSVNDEFAGEMQRFLYEKHHDWIVGSVISNCLIYKKSLLGAIIFIIKRSGFYYFFKMAKLKVINKLIYINNKVTPKSLAKKYNIEIFYSKNINDERSRKRLSELKPDLIISTNFSHFVGKRVREISFIGTWNLHKSYLPHYRGMAPSFYALLNGEKSVGVTLHVIDNEIDTGPIISQVIVPVKANDTVYDLNIRTSVEGGKMLVRLLEEKNIKSLKPTFQQSGNWPTYSFPTIHHIQEFRKKKLKF